MLKAAQGVHTVESRPLRLEVRLHNLRHIAAAFGSEAHAVVRSRMPAAISHFLSSDETSPVQVALAPPGAVSVRPIDCSLIAIDIQASLSETDVTLLVERLSLALAVEPTIWGTARIHVVASVWIAWPSSSASMDDATDERFVPVVSEALFGDEPDLDAADWGDLYRRDMAVAAQLFEELTAGRLRLAFQPICMAGRFESILYQECLLRGAEPDRSPADIIAALERLGLSRALDNRITRLALVKLRDETNLRLGVNISAQGAIVDGWWAAIRGELEAAPELAGRLTIEITETASLPPLADAVAFVSWMKSAGCKIALDDFGAGRNAIRSLYALTPDIVKVDAFFLRQARDSERGHDAFKSLIGLSRAIGGAVVVEGVESKLDSRIAAEAGAPWQQGDFSGSPRFAAIAPDLRYEAPEPPPTFGQRPNAPNLYLAKKAEAIRTLSDGAAAFPQQVYFDLGSLRWAVPLSAALWGLIACAVWLLWKWLS